MSGKSNVVFWLEKRGHKATGELVAAIFEKAKQSSRLLTDEEIEDVIKGVKV